MAAYNVELRKNDGSAFADLFYPKTTWAMVEGKPSTYTPTAHEHSIVDINGLIEGSSFSGTYPVLFYIGADNRIFTHSGITFTGATQILTINGQNVVVSNDSRLSDSRPASDVYAWAKAASKPSYTYSEVGAAASGHNHSGVYEPVFSKNTAFNKNFGTTAGTVCQGDDSRLSDARTPLSHSLDSHTGSLAVTKGGTGLSSIAIGEMLYASGANTIAKVASSSFGRGLLNASTGVMVSGLNANTLAGYGHSDFRKTSEAVFRSIKDWTTYVSTNGSTAVALPTTESVSDRLIGVVLNTSTSSTYQRTVVWIKISSTSGTTYRAAFNLGSVGQDSSTSSIYIYEAEFYQSSGVLYIDDATRTSLTPGSPVNGTKVSTSTDINIWDIYVLD